MLDHSSLIAALLFMAVGTLYSSVGHAGSSGYLALMALMGVQTAVMRPASLVLNTLVAAIACAQFYRAGYVGWRLVLPFSAGSIPLAYLGGRIGLTPVLLNTVLGAILLFTALRMALTAVRTSGPPRPICLPPIPLSMAAGGAIGAFSGLTGTGGGVFLGPLLILVGWADPKHAAGASALFSLGNSVAAIAGISLGNWDLPPALPGWAIAAGAGGVVGAAFGSRVAAPGTLRALLSIVLLVAGAKLMMT